MLERVRLRRNETQNRKRNAEREKESLGEMQPGTRWIEKDGEMDRDRRMERWTKADRQQWMDREKTEKRQIDGSRQKDGKLAAELGREREAKRQIGRQTGKWKESVFFSSF